MAKTDTKATEVKENVLNAEVPENNAVTETKGTSIANPIPEIPMGFEDEDAGDLIVPRVKLIQTLSPERKDKEASEGDIINSLTKAKYNGKTFIAVFKFNNNILWRDRADGGGILCIARDGKRGEESDGNNKLCASCKRCEFDNTKQGRESFPTCTKYINFFGFFAGERTPIILSFAKTNYNEGKKLYSLAKVTMQNMWNFGYALNEKVMAKNGNEWYIMTVTPAGPTSEEDKQFALSLYQTFRTNITTLNYDMGDETSSSENSKAPDVDGTEY